MINKAEYIQMLTFFNEKKLPILENEFLAFLNEIREIQHKLQKELEYYAVYPHLDLTQTKAYQREIKTLCINAGIYVCFFDNRQDHNFKNKDFAMYEYKGINITDLLVFKKDNKNKIESINYDNLLLDDE